MQKKYQQLRSEGNKKAAKAIYLHLKQYKAMSQETWDGIYMQANHITWKHGSFNSLWETTFHFLKDHGLVTLESINGLNIYVATQKCFRTKCFLNATIEYQEVTNSDIDKAIAFQRLNDGGVPAMYEGTVIAKILGLTGKVQKMYAKNYEANIAYYKELNKTKSIFYQKFTPKMAILSPLREMTNIKKV